MVLHIVSRLLELGKTSCGLSNTSHTHAGIEGLSFVHGLLYLIPSPVLFCFTHCFNLMTFFALYKVCAATRLRGRP